MWSHTDHRSLPAPVPISRAHRGHRIFNILAERPKTVAEFLVPSARAAAVPLSNGAYIKFLTGPGAGYRFMTAAVRMNRLFTINKKDQTATDNESGTVYKLR